MSTQQLEVDWKVEWFLNIPVFPHRKNKFWRDRDNARNFLDGLASKWSIKRPQDWNNITVPQIINSGGTGLLSKHKNSLFLTLQQTYPGIHSIKYLPPN